jgi:hypothetical protein
MRAFYLALPLLATAFGCSDAIPPTPQGAFLVNFTDNGAECPHKSHKGEAGVVSEIARTTVIVDGTNGADISCSVTGSGTFAIKGTVIVGTDGMNVNVPAINPSATMASPATGQLSYFSFVTAGDAYSSPEDTPCNFYFKSGTPEGVAAGKVWMSFSCPTVVESNSTCAISESILILENCDQ